MLYCFLFFCSFPLLDIGISEMIVPFYFAFVFIASLAVLSVFICKIFLILLHVKDDYWKEKGIHVDEDDNQAKERFQGHESQRQHALMCPSPSR